LRYLLSQKLFISKHLIGGSITTEGFEKRINEEFDQLIFQKQTQQQTKDKYS
jgi:hypothetical protein